MRRPPSPRRPGRFGRQLGLGIVGGALLALALALPAAAGGWASVVDDRALAPDDEGSTLVRFTLLQHGETPVDRGEVSVVATHEVTGRQVSGTAVREPGTAGGWIASFPLPEAGQWIVEIRHADLEIIAADAIRVTAAPLPDGAPAAGSSASAPAWYGVALLLLAVGLAGAAAVGLALRRRAPRVVGAPRTSG